MSLGVMLIIAGCILTVIEIFSLTFYMLAIAIGCFISSVVTLHGGSDAATVATLGVTILIGLPIAHFIRLKLNNSSSEDVSNDDVGRSVTVNSMNNTDLRVSYRGSTWSGRLQNSNIDVKEGDTLYIHKRKGNVLILDTEKPT